MFQFSFHQRFFFCFCLVLKRISTIIETSPCKYLKYKCINGNILPIFTVFKVCPLKNQNRRSFFRSSHSMNFTFPLGCWKQGCRKPFVFGSFSRNNDFLSQLFAEILSYRGVGERMVQHVAHRNLGQTDKREKNSTAYK